MKTSGIVLPFSSRTMQQPIIMIC